MVGLVRSRAALQAEILVLRHQLNVLRRKSPKRVAVGNIDRLLFVGLYRFSPKVIDGLKSSSPRRLWLSETQSVWPFGSNWLMLTADG